MGSKESNLKFEIPLRHRRHVQREEGGKRGANSMPWEEARSRILFGFSSIYS